MAKSFAVTTPATDPLRPDAKGHAEVLFTVTNTTSRPLRGMAKVKALGDTKGECLSIEGETERDFAAGTTQQFTVTFDAPVTPIPKTDTAVKGDTKSPAASATGTGAAGSMPAKKYPFRLDVSSALNPDEDFTEGPTVSVEVAAAAVAAPPKKFPLWIIPLIAVVLIVIAISSWLLLRKKGVEVPDVVDKPIAEATSILKDHKLRASIKETKLTGKVSAGRVAEQQPDAGGKPVPEGSSVELVVEAERPPSPTGPVVLINFADSAPSATWTNNAGQILPFNGSDGDDRGFVINRDNAVLENNTTAVKVIETHPKWENNGNITGVFVLPQPISAGDKFRTRVGFLEGAGAGNVHLRVLFNGSVLDEISESYDGSLRDWTVNLGDYTGQQGQFSLQVLAIPTSAQAWLCWINPRIER